MSLPPDIAPDEVVVLVGNPSPASRTSTVAQTVAAALTGRPDGSPRVVELCELDPSAAGDPVLLEAQEAVRRAALLVVATPVYKASFTGALKTFLDGLEPTALESTVAVPVVLSAASAHGALADLQLRIVLQAVGALLPVPSFVVEEHHLDDLPQYADAWEHRFGTPVAAVVRALRPEGVRAR